MFNFTKNKLVKNMQTLRPLPMGVKEFVAWSDRIISQAMIPGATPDSQRFALADLILHLNSTEDHKEDAYFVKFLRKVAVNQVADHVRGELKEASDKRKREAQAASEAAKSSEVIANQSETDAGVLEDQKV